MVDCWNRSAAAFIEEATPAPATVSQTGAGAKVGSGRGAEVGNVAVWHERMGGGEVRGTHRRIERLVNYMRLHMHMLMP